MNDSALNDSVLNDSVTFFGYVREDGSVGARNHVIVLPSTVCASHVAENIGAAVQGTIVIPNQHGCAQVGADIAQTVGTLVGMGKNPNVAAVLVVGLGCETISAQEMAEQIATTGKKVLSVVIQDEGGTTKTTERGIRIARQLVEEVSRFEREGVGLDNLVLGTECGGSDACSGLSANPAVGAASDAIVRAGGTVILSETTEFIGAEHILAERAASKAVADKILEIVERVEKRALLMGSDIRGANPVPGNIKGGITTIEEKSSGCIYKGGTSPVKEVVAYAETPTQKGVVIMDTPGNDVESVTGMAAGGPQVVVFTTGRGSPVGFPIVPVIKVASNTPMYQRMQENMDINAGSIIDGDETVEEVGKRLLDRIIAVASGERTKAEVLGHKEFSITQAGPTF